MRTKTKQGHIVETILSRSELSNPFFLEDFFFRKSRKIRVFFLSHSIYCWLHWNAVHRLIDATARTRKKTRRFFLFQFSFFCTKMLIEKVLTISWIGCDVKKREKKKISCFMMNELWNLEYSSFRALNEFSSCGLDSSFFGVKHQVDMVVMTSNILVVLYVLSK